VKNFQERLQAASLWILFAWFAGAYFLATYGIGLLDKSARLDPSDALIRVGGSVLFGGVMTALTAWQRRRNGGLHTLVRMNKAIKSGTVPEDAEPSLWVPALQRRRRQNEQVRWFSPIVFGLFTILGIWLITQEPDNVIAWIITVLFVAIAIYSVVQSRMMVAKIDVVLAYLHAGPSRAERRRR
jgi:hypothetical protein